MIDEENRGTMLRVLLADDVELDIAELPCETTEQGRGKVDAAPAIVRQHPDYRARAHRRGEAAEHAGRPNQRHRMVLASLGLEPHDVPPARSGVAGEAPPRGDRVRGAGGGLKRARLRPLFGGGGGFSWGFFSACG